MNCGYEIKWSYDPRSYESNFCNCVKKPENFRTSTGVWTRDLAIPVRRSNQLSYEDTDVGSWSFVLAFPRQPAAVQILIGRFETVCIPWIPLVAEFGTDHIEKAVFVTSASIFSETVGGMRLKFGEEM